MKGPKTIPMRTHISLFMIGVGLYLILAQTPAQAHHKFAALYDATKPVTLRGAVSKLEWLNPHVWIQIDVKKNDGTVAQWMIEAASPNSLTSRGLTRDFLKVGTQVTVNGYQSKDGSLHVSGRDVALPNSQPLFIG